MKRAREMGGWVELSKEEKKSIKKLCTHAVFLQEITGMPHEVDHIQAYCNGGKHQRDNLQLLTRNEHRAKSKIDMG